jgi:hypothetical protein
MVYRLPLVIGMLAFLAIPTLAQEKEKAPLQERPAQKAPPFPGSAPRFVAVWQVNTKKAEIILTEVREQMVPVQVMEKVKQGNQEVNVTKIVYQAVNVSENRLYSLKEVKFSNSKGDPISEEKALERLKPGTVVLTTTGAGKLSPEYLALLRDNVLIVNVPQPGVAPGGAGGAAVFAPVGGAPPAIVAPMPQGVPLPNFQNVPPPKNR